MTARTAARLHQSGGPPQPKCSTETLEQTMTHEQAAYRRHPLDAEAPTGQPQAELRDRIRRAVCEAEGFAWDSDMLEPDEYGEVADAVLAVLPTPADRAAVSTALWAAAEHNTAAEWICCEPIDPAHDLCVQGGAALRMLKALLVDDPEAWKPAPLLDEMMRLLPPAGSVAEAHRLALSEVLDLGTGAPWDAIHERVQELRRMAAEAQQQPHTETPCGPAPSQCDAESGEPCTNHEREAAHAEGEHCFCGPECEAASTP